jgi:hypothetical protein
MDWNGKECDAPDHEYFADHQHAVTIEDVSRWLPELIEDNMADRDRPGDAGQG